MKRILFLNILFLSTMLCSGQNEFDIDTNLNYCKEQINKSLLYLNDDNKMPRNILSDTTQWWNCTSIYDWTSGFWSGILWYVYDFTQDPKILKKAQRFSKALFPIASKKPHNHDLGFMMYCSLGNGYRLTQNDEYKKKILQSADSLAGLYHPVAGTINSWPYYNKQMNWHHNTIIDNMINLELLFWAAKNGGSPHLYNIAEKHAKKTMRNHFRDDYTSYHVIAYDTITGNKVAGITHQGFADHTMWARGQAWAIYGFTMCYRETGDEEFLTTAQKALEVYLSRLPKDYIPYWDFDAPNIPNEPKDASAAATVASALLEMSLYGQNQESKLFYKQTAINILQSLSSENYQSRGKNHAFLRHATGHKPKNSEIDCSIIYADYYYIEALIRLKHINEFNSL